MQKALEAFRLPPDLVSEQGYPRKLKEVFRDSTDLGATANLTESIKEALDQSRTLIVICSERVKTSKWVTAEIEYFQSRGRRQHILPVVIEGVPEEVYPELLISAENNGPLRVGQQDYPLGADLRAQKGASPRKLLRNATVALAAGILQCDYNQLAQRSAVRAAQIRSRLITGAVAIAGVLVSALFYAGYQNIRAEQATTISRANLAQAHFGRGFEAESSRRHTAAKVQFAQALATFETEGSRKKLLDNWFVAKQLWAIDLSSKPAKGSAAAAGSAVITFDRNGRLHAGTADGELKSFSPDGEWLSTVKLPAAVTSLAANPIATVLAVGMSDGTLIILDPQSGERYFTTQFVAPVSALAFNSSGTALTVGPGTGGLRVIDPVNGQLIFRSPGGHHDVPVSSASFEPNGSELIWSMSRSLYRGDIGGAHQAAAWPMQRVTAQDDAISATAWSSGQDPLLAFAGYDGPIQLLRRNAEVNDAQSPILSFSTRRLPVLRELPGHNGNAVSSLAFLPDGVTLVSAGFDGEVRVWNTHTGQLKTVIPAHTGAVTDIALTEDGEYFASVGVDNILKYWRLGSELAWSLSDSSTSTEILNSEVAPGTFDIDEIAIASDDSILFGQRNSTIRRWTNDIAGSSAMVRDSVTRDRYATWFIDATGSRLGVVSRDFGTDLEILGHSAGIVIYDLPGFSSSVNIPVDNISVASWLGKQQVVTGLRSGQVVVRGLSEHNPEIRQLGSRSVPVLAVDATPSGSHVAALWSDGHFTVWEAPDLREVLTQQLTTNPVSQLSISDDGKRLLLTSHGAIGQVSLWGLAEAESIATLSVWARSSAFSRDSQWLAIGSDTGGEVTIYNANTGAEIAVVGIAARRVRALVFNSAGTTLYAAGDNGTLFSIDLNALNDIRSRSADSLLVSAVEESGLTLDGLSHKVSMPLPRRNTSVPTTIDLADLTEFQQFHAQASTAIRRLQSDEHNPGVPDKQQIAAFQKLLEQSDAGQFPAADPAQLALTRSALFVQLGNGLSDQSDTDGALNAYREAMLEAESVFQLRPDQGWPGLWQAFDHHAAELRNNGKNVEAFEVTSRRMAVHRALLQIDSPTAPGYVQLWQQFILAVRSLPDNLRDVRGLALAAEQIDFLRKKIDPAEPKPDTELLQGVAMFCEAAASLALRVERFPVAKANFQYAEQYRASVVRYLAGKQSEEQFSARADWADTLGKLAITAYREVIHQYENPVDQSLSAQKTARQIEYANAVADRASAQWDLIGGSENLDRRLQGFHQEFHQVIPLLRAEIQRLQFENE